MLFSPPISRILALVVLGLVTPLRLHAADGQISPGEAKARASDCFACHAVDHKVVGPAYQDVASRYASKGDAFIPMLMKKIQAGGAGNWGSVPMTAHSSLSDADAKIVVKWILSLKGSGAPATAANSVGSHGYKTVDGKHVQSDVAIFTGADQKQVTPAVFNGYEQYNSYCFRCHGGDAIGGEYAPDLRKSLGGGMSYQQFLSTAMAGRPDKGMPSWAGFFEEKDIQSIYDYIKARQLNLIAEGRPPSGSN